MRCTPLTVAVLALTACGGGGDDEGGPRDGRFDSPDDFDRTGCTPGSLAGVDPQAIYHLQIDFDGQVDTAAMRFDVDGPGRFGGVLLGREATWATATADDIFLYLALDDGAVRSVDLCGRDGELLTGRFAYCTAEECYLATVRAKRVDRLSEADAGGLQLVGEWEDPLWEPALTVNVRVDGDLAYLARFQDGLRVVDITDPAHPRNAGHAPVQFPMAGERFNDVKLVTAGGKRWAIAASNKVGAVVFDVTEPARPLQVATFGTVALDNKLNVHTLDLDGGRAYLANVGRGLEIWDVADPAHPAKLGEYVPADAPEGAFLHDLYVRGDRAYLNFWNAGMKVVDVSSPAQPRLLGTFAGYGETSSHSSWVTEVGGRTIAAHGDEQWGSHVRLVDVTEASPAATFDDVGEWGTRPEVSAHNVMAFGSEVFAAYYQDGVRILDISDPSRPRLTAWFNTWPGYDRRYGYGFFEGVVGIDVDQARRRIYVADSHRGLLILAREP